MDLVKIGNLSVSKKGSCIFVKSTFRLKNSEHWLMCILGIGFNLFAAHYISKELRDRLTLTALLKSLFGVYMRSEVGEDAERSKLC